MSNEEQLEYWNGDAGKRWAQEDNTMAQLLHPVCEALLDHANVEGCSSALDIGCGGGSQSLLLAQLLGANAKVQGVDISAPMLEVAQSKIANRDADTAALSFLQADASGYDFEPASFDLLFSRFGVMFFDDPGAAFSNLRRALQPGGRVAFCCWQAMKDNVWTRIPVQAALQHLPAPDAPDPHAPGPFAFADPERLRGILEASDFADIAIEPYNAKLNFIQADSLQKAVRELAMIGPVSRLIAGQEPDVLERVFGSMEEALAPFYHDGALTLPCAIWFVTATTR